jgi:1-acyl-sn-glycerol-3-phosphate acyltransferase
MARAWGGVLLTVLRIVCRLDYRIEGAENIPAGNHIALIKHSSAWETFAQVVLVPPHVWVLKRELTWVPFLGWALRLMRCIAIDRRAGKSAVQSVLDQGKATTRRG